MLLYHYAYPIRERWAYYRLNMPFGARVGAVGVQGFYLLAIGTILMLGVWQSQVFGEPFTIDGGVSIVPTEVLRLLAGLLAVHFALESWRIIRQNNEDLAREFCLESPRQIERGERDARLTHKWPPRLLARLWLAYRRRSIYHWRNTRRRLKLDVGDRSLEPVSVAGLWYRYQRLGLFRERFLRHLPWAAAFMAFSVVLIQLFGQPLIPAGGPWNPGLDKAIIIVLTVIPFLILLIGMVDATRLCIELVRWFVDGRLVWPEATCQTWEERFGMKTEDLREWLAVDFIAKRTEAIGRLVYFPFIVIFVMILSRSTYFDGWKMPVGLFVVIISSALYAVLSAFVLRKTAENTRQAALSSLQERLTKLAGTDRERESKQLELLMERIRDIRKGAFHPWRQQPVVKALFWFIGGTSIAGLEFFSLYG